jgi:tRNA threonylcarbamoyl adenosine modification protein YjeE
MGVGKSTFARALLHALGVHQPPEGSPTFAIAHEYESPRGGVLHVDFYRIRSEDEIDEAGITAYLWERELIVITEWLSMFEEFQARVLEPGRGRNWQIALAHSAEGAELRDVAISKS